MKSQKEIRRVPADWRHPLQRTWKGYDEFKPLFANSYRQQCECCGQQYLQTGQVSTAATEEADHMPEWPVESRICVQLYETATAGTPISPVMPSEDSLIHWLVVNKIGLVAGYPGTPEEWKSAIYDFC